MIDLMTTQTAEKQTNSHQFRWKKEGNKLATKKQPPDLTIEEDEFLKWVLIQDRPEILWVLT